MINRWLAENRLGKSMKRKDARKDEKEEWVEREQRRRDDGENAEGRERKREEVGGE